MAGSDPPPELTVRVRLFAGLREAMGWAEQRLTTTVGSTPAALWPTLDPAGDPHLPAGVRVAINRQFVDPATPLADGDELAFLPPISGG
jgi:molybdopterin synthase sulfur carrier subunit